MTEVREQAPQRRVSEIDQIKPGKTYRLHRFIRGEEGKVQEAPPEDFYIDENLVQNGFLYVRKPNPRSGSTDFYGTFRLKALGSVLWSSAIKNEDKRIMSGLTSMEDFRPGSAQYDSGDPSYENWVEEIGERDLTPST